MRRNLAALAAVVIVGTWSAPAFAGFKEVLLGEGPHLADRLQPDGVWDISVRDPRTGVPEMYGVGEGAPVPYDLTFTVEQGLVGVLQPMIATGDRGLKQITFRRNGQLLAQVIFPKDPTALPKVVAGAAHLVPPPGWELVPSDHKGGGEPVLRLVNPDADEEGWVKDTVRRVSRDSMKFAVTAGHPLYFFVNTQLLSQGGAAYEFAIKQDGKHGLQDADSIAFSVFRARGVDSGAEYDLDDRPYDPRDFPMDVPYFGDSEVKGVSYDFGRGTMTGEDGVTRPLGAVLNSGGVAHTNSSGSSRIAQNQPAPPAEPAPKSLEELAQERLAFLLKLGYPRHEQECTRLTLTLDDVLHPVPASDRFGCKCPPPMNVWHYTEERTLVEGSEPGLYHTACEDLPFQMVYDLPADYAGGTPLSFVMMYENGETIAPTGGMFHFEVTRGGATASRDFKDVGGQYGHILPAVTTIAQPGDLVVVYTGLPEAGGQPLVGPVEVKEGEGYRFYVFFGEDGSPIQPPGSRPIEPQQ